MIGRPTAIELALLAWCNVGLNLCMLLVTLWGIRVLRRAKYAIRELNNNIGWFRRNFIMDGNHDGAATAGHTESRRWEAGRSERRSMPRT